MKQILGLMAVIGLTLTAVTACATSEESAPTVASEAETSEAASLKKDCARIYYERAQAIIVVLENEEAGISGFEDDGFRSDEKDALNQKAYVRIWPQMNDPDLKSIFRTLANNLWDDALNDDPNWVAYKTICADYL